LRDEISNVLQFATSAFQGPSSQPDEVFEGVG
jgi:hypothetical protein